MLAHWLLLSLPALLIQLLKGLLRQHQLRSRQLACPWTCTAWGRGSTWHRDRSTLWGIDRATRVWRVSRLTLNPIIDYMMNTYMTISQSHEGLLHASSKRVTLLFNIHDVANCSRCKAELSSAA